MSARTGLQALIRALRSRNYAIYTAGNGISLIGIWMQRVATGWLAWELTASGAWLGLIGFADLAPTLIVGPVAGVAADRWNLLTVAKASKALATVHALSLFLLTATGQMTIELLWVLTVIGGAIAAFNQPARLALVHSLVARADLPAAVAISSIVFNLARFIGPAAAGLVIVTSGVAAAYAANAATFAVFLLALYRIQVVPNPAAKTDRGSFLQEIVEGVRYAGSHPGIAAILIVLIITSVASRPLVELLPGFAADVFSAGAGALAVLTSSIGIGAVGGGLWLGGRARAQGLTRVVLGTACGLGLTGILFTLTETLWMAAPILALAGFCMAGTGVAAQTLIQLSVAGRMRGRVLSLYGLIFRGAPAVGALIMGIASERFGFRWPVAVGGLIAAIGALWFFTRHDRIAKALERSDAS